MLKDGPLSTTTQPDKKGVTTPGTPTRTSQAAPRTPMRSEGRISENLVTPPMSPGDEPLQQIRQDLCQEMDMQVQIMMQQMRNEQAANTIHLSQLTAAQMQQMAEEIKRSNMASREQDIRQEKLMQMILQAQAKPEALSASQCPNDLSVRKTSRGLGCEKGGPAEGPDVLEVRATKVRSLCMDPGGRPGGHRGCEDRGFILEPKAVQESEEGGPCGGAGSGFIGTMSELVPGFHPEQQGRRGEGAHHPDRRGLSGDAQWAKCATRRAIRWASKATDGKDPHFIVEKSYWILGAKGEWAETQNDIPKEASEIYVHDDWLTPDRKFEETWWRGRTTFVLENVAEARHYVAEKKGQDEVNLSRESAQDQEEWKLADLSEWNKVTQSGAVQVLDLETSRKVRQELQEAGQEDRILPTKIARRYKPGEQPSEAPTKKSRLCIRGDLDPDILELERFSPTLNTVNFNVLLQIAANQKMTTTVGDLKNAFCQSQPLHRPKGSLYFQQPKEGVVGLHPE